METTIFKQDSFLEILKKPVEVLKELYENSNPEERDKILKCLGGALGLFGFFAFVAKL